MSKGRVAIVAILAVIGCAILSISIMAWLSEFSAVNVENHEEVIVFDAPKTSVRTRCPFCGQNYIFDTQHLDKYSGMTFSCTDCKAILAIGKNGVEVATFQ